MLPFMPCSDARYRVSSTVVLYRQVEMIKVIFSRNCFLSKLSHRPGHYWISTGFKHALSWYYIPFHCNRLRLCTVTVTPVHFIVVVYWAISGCQSQSSDFQGLFLAFLSPGPHASNPSTSSVPCNEMADHCSSWAAEEQKQKCPNVQEASQRVNWCFQQWGKKAPCNLLGQWVIHGARI